jgi:hypothetical protein
MDVADHVSQIQAAVRDLGNVRPADVAQITFFALCHGAPSRLVKKLNRLSAMASYCAFRAFALS